MDIVGGSRPLAEQRGGDSPSAKFATCGLHNLFPLRHKKSLIRDGATTPCNSTTCTQFTRIRQNYKQEKNKNFFTPRHNAPWHKKATINERKGLVVPWLLLAPLWWRCDKKQPSGLPDIA
jgi:hypothetical protein